MYIPEQFREIDAERILVLVDAHPFGMLVTTQDGQPFVNHLPLLLDRHGATPRLLGHMAQANPQWRHFESGREVLAVFQGPHAYVSPGWYASPGVPTWNYAVVHIRGVARLIADESELEALLDEMTRRHEAILPEPWQADLTPERRARLFGMIVGFEIAVTDIQAKFKLSQNRPEDDRRRVADTLACTGKDSEAAVARLMRENN